MISRACGNPDIVMKENHLLYGGRVVCGGVFHYLCGRGERSLSLACLQNWCI